MAEPLTVIYNDTCPICSREVDMYRRLSQQGDLQMGFEGLSACDLARFDLTPETAARRFHVLKDGELISGIPAFALLWEELPRMGWMATAVRLPVVRPLVNGLYDYVLAPVLFRMHVRRQARSKA
jgi:predicted DCC family thiol-disulfide oxidoreductase YuxK